MFNFSILLTTATLLLVESYKLINLKLNLTLLPSKKDEHCSTFFPVQITTITILYSQFTNSASCVSLTSIQLLLILFSVYFFWSINYGATIMLLICWVMSTLFSSTQNLTVFVFMAEFLSFIIFFFLFFNLSKNHTNRTIPIIYFILLNILTLLWGILLIIFILYTHGTTSITLLTSQGILHTLAAPIFVLYVIMKLGQGPAIFFKFRFYRILSLNDLIFYLYTYLIFVWPIMFYLLNSLHANVGLPYNYLILLITTIFLLFSLMSYSSVWDFLVFSTWVFIWYALLLTL